MNVRPVDSPDVEPRSAGRNLIICCDGTANSFDTGRTNVLRMTMASVQDPDRQLVFYDPGVGTLPEHHLWSKVGRFVSRVRQLAIGAGLEHNVQEAYTFLMENVRPDDRIYLFGFSRGAYTARVLASMLYNVGLLPRGNQHLVPYAMRLLGARQGGQPKWRDFSRFRRTFARPSPASNSGRYPVHFLGIWDTVKSVGWLWSPAVYPNTADNPLITTMRHAVAIDERRAFYRQHLLRPRRDDADVDERWFPGVHADVGGGYPPDHGGLWRPAFEWLVAEARRAGLEVNEEQLRRVREDPKPPDQPAWLEPVAQSLKGAWWLAEFVPKPSKTKRKGKWRTVFRIGRGRFRQIVATANAKGKSPSRIDAAALERLREDDSYRPGSICPCFVERVKSLEVVPEVLVYDCVCRM